MKPDVEPDVASSDATNIELRMERDEDGYVLKGRKWFASNAMRPDCRVPCRTGSPSPVSRSARRRRRHGDFPLASMYAHIRTLRLADGPDEVHKRAIARRELHKHDAVFDGISDGISDAVSDAASGSASGGTSRNGARTAVS